MTSNNCWRSGCAGSSCCGCSCSGSGSSSSSISSSNGIGYKVHLGTGSVHYMGTTPFLPRLDIKAPLVNTWPLMTFATKKDGECGVFTGLMVHKGDGHQVERIKPWHFFLSFSFCCIFILRFMGNCVYVPFSIMR